MLTSLRGAIRFTTWGLIGALTALGFGQLPDTLDPENKYPMVLSKDYGWESAIEKGATPRSSYVPVVGDDAYEEE